MVHIEMKFVVWVLLSVVGYILLWILDRFLSDSDHFLARAWLNIVQLCIALFIFYCFVLIGNTAAMYGWQWVIMGLMMLLDVFLISYNFIQTASLGWRLGD